MTLEAQLSGTSRNRNERKSTALETQRTRRTACSSVRKAQRSGTYTRLARAAQTAWWRGVSTRPSRDRDGPWICWHADRRSSSESAGWLLRAPNYLLPVARLRGLASTTYLHSERGLSGLRRFYAHLLQGRPLGAQLVDSGVYETPQHCLVMELLLTHSHLRREWPKHMETCKAGGLPPAARFVALSPLPKQRWSRSSGGAACRRGPCPAGSRL